MGWSPGITGVLNGRTLTDFEYPGYQLPSNIEQSARRKRAKSMPRNTDRQSTQATFPERNSSNCCKIHHPTARARFWRSSAEAPGMQSPKTPDPTGSTGASGPCKTPDTPVTNPLVGPGRGTSGRSRVGMVRYCRNFTGAQLNRSVHAKPRNSRLSPPTPPFFSLLTSTTKVLPLHRPQLCSSA